MVSVNTGALMTSSKSLCCNLIGAAFLLNVPSATLILSSLLFVAAAADFLVSYQPKSASSYASTVSYPVAIGRVFPATGGLSASTTGAAALPSAILR